MCVLFVEEGVFLFEDFYSCVGFGKLQVKMVVYKVLLKKCFEKVLDDLGCLWCVVSKIFFFGVSLIMVSG